MSEPISIEKLSDSLHVRKDQLRRILTKDVEGVKNMIAPWQEEMRNFITQAPYKDFGTYLRKVLKTPINTKQMVSTDGSLIVGRNFYYRNRGKKRVMPSEKIFCTFSRKYADLITTGHKRELVLDFMQFKLAMCKYLEPFSKPQSFEVSLPVETATVGCVGISDGLISDNEKPKVYNYLAGQETVQPDFMTIFFTEFPQFNNQTIPDIMRGYDNRINRDYVAIVSLFKNDYPEAYTLLGSTVIHFDELVGDEMRNFRHISSLNTAQLQLNILKGNSQRAQAVKSDLDWVQNEQQIFAYANEDVMAGGKVIGVSTNPKFKYLIPQPEHNRVNQSRKVITNWTEILSLPEVQKTINNYISTWNLITRSWNFMKQKYAYKVLLHGHF